MRMRCVCLLVGVWMLWAVPVQAQTVAPTVAASVEVLPAGGPFATVPAVAELTTPVADITCGLSPSPVVSDPVNPTAAEVDDPGSAGQVCRVPFPDVLTLPEGTYRWTVRAIAASCQPQNSPEQSPCPSPRGSMFITTGTSTFRVEHPAPVILPPAAPTGLRIIQ